MTKSLTERLRTRWPFLVLFLALFAFIALSFMTACATTSGEQSPATAQLTDEQVLFAAEASLVGAAQIAVAAKRAGQLSEADRTAIADGLETGWQVMLSARCVHAVASGDPIRNDVVARCQAAVAEHGSSYRALAFQVLAIAGTARATAQRSAPR